MGYIRHHAIVVTSYSRAYIEKAHIKAWRVCGPRVSGLVLAPINGYTSFLVGPDGSKEGWDDSDKGDEARARFIAWLDRQRWEDGSSPYSWAEIQYGDDNGEALIVAHDDEESRRKPGDLEITRT